MEVAQVEQQVQCSSSDGLEKGSILSGAGSMGREFDLMGELRTILSVRDSKISRIFSEVLAEVSANGIPYCCATIAQILPN